jgi:hypothetical protein
LSVMSVVDGGEIAYGGSSGMGDIGGVSSTPVPRQNRPRSVVLTPPPLALLVFALEEKP